MAFGDYRHKVRRIAFITVMAWIALATLMVILMIWNAISDIWLTRIVWTATALTAGTLGCCLTYLAFLAAEEGSRLREKDGGSEGDAESLREAFEMAKIKPKDD